MSGAWPSRVKAEALTIPRHPPREIYICCAPKAEAMGLHRACMTYAGHSTWHSNIHRGCVDAWTGSSRRERCVSVMSRARGSSCGVRTYLVCVALAVSRESLTCRSTKAARTEGSRRLQ